MTWESLACYCTSAKAKQDTTSCPWAWLNSILPKDVQNTSPRQTTAYTLPCSNEENHSYHASMASTVTVTCSSAHRYYPHTHWKRFKRWTSLYSTGYVLVQAWSHVHMVSMYTPPSHGQLMKLSHSEPHSFADVKLSSVIKLFSWVWWCGGHTVA